MTEYGVDLNGENVMESNKCSGLFSNIMTLLTAQMITINW